MPANQTKPYLYYTQHETDKNGQPITALYLAPKAHYTTTGHLVPDTCDVVDDIILNYIATGLNMSMPTPWEFESPDISPPDVIAWMAKPEHWKIFSTSDKYAQHCKNESGF